MFFTQISVWSMWRKDHNLCLQVIKNVLLHLCPHNRGQSWIIAGLFKPFWQSCEHVDSLAAFICRSRRWLGSWKLRPRRSSGSCMTRAQGLTRPSVSGALRCQLAGQRAHYRVSTMNPPTALHLTCLRGTPGPKKGSEKAQTKKKKEASN